MRKLTIPNYSLKVSAQDDITSLLSSFLFRVDPKGRAFNKAASKLKFQRHSSQQSRGWITERGHMVLINDERQEVALMGSRSLITSSLVLEECLQINRGNLHIDLNRNDFFVSDDKGSTPFHTEPKDKLPFLDLLWYMHEQSVDVLDIDSGMLPPDEKGYQSRRYRDIIDGYIKKSFGIALPFLTELWGKYEENLKIQDGETINWETSFNSREWDNTNGFNLERKKYSTEDGIMSRFYHYRALTTHLVDTAPRQFEEWYQEETKGGKKEYSIHQQNVILLMHFGFAEEYHFSTPEQTALSVLDSMHVSHTKRLIAQTKFKRCNDWTCDFENLVRAEALKLRRLAQEGTFDE